METKRRACAHRRRPGSARSKAATSRRDARSRPVAAGFSSATKRLPPGGARRADRRRYWQTVACLEAPAASLSAREENAFPIAVALQDAAIRLCERPVPADRDFWQSRKTTPNRL